MVSSQQIWRWASKKLFKQETRNQRFRLIPAQPKKGWILIASLLIATPILSSGPATSAPISIDLNRALQIGWYALRVQNPYGTNYTGLTAIKSYNPTTKEFVFINQQGQEVTINASEISFIYFRQLPDRADVNVNAGNIRNIQITPYKEFLYDIPPGRLNIEEGSLILDTRWRMAAQKPFDVSTTLDPAEGGTIEQIEIPRRIQMNYLGNRFLVESELVNMITRTRPEAGGGTVPRPLPTVFPIPIPPGGQ